MTSGNRKRPTSGSAAKSVEKRRRVEINDDDGDDEGEDQLVIDDSAKEDHRRVLNAINGDIPNGGRKNGFHGDRNHRPSLSDVLKNKGRPLRDESRNGDHDDDVDGFAASRFPIAKQASSITRRTRDGEGIAERRGPPAQEEIQQENDRVVAKKIQDNVERRRIKKHPPSSEEYVYVTESDKGKRVYLAVKPEEDDEESASELGFAVGDADTRVVRSRGRQLLGVDYNALKRRVMMEMEARETAVRADETEAEEMQELEMVESSEGDGDKHHLWVEKYAPRGYTVSYR